MGGVAVEAGDLGEEFGGAQRGGDAEEYAEPFGRYEGGEDAFALRPGAAEDAFGFAEPAAAAVAPERPFVGGGELRRERLALAVQGGEAFVGDAGDVHVAERADGQGADDGRGGEGLAAGQAYGAAAGAAYGDGRDG